MKKPLCPNSGEPEKRNSQRRQAFLVSSSSPELGRGGIFLLLLCAGCAPRPATPSTQADTPPEKLNPSLHITLGTSPSTPTSLDPTAFIARLTDAAGKPVSRAHLSLALSMPSMDMGDNFVQVSETATQGTYRGTGRFTMAGDWRAVVSVSAGADRAAQTFSFQVR